MSKSVATPNDGEKVTVQIKLLPPFLTSKVRMLGKTITNTKPSEEHTTDEAVVNVKHK